MPRNPFTEFESNPEAPSRESESEFHTRVNGVLSSVQNPFGEFVEEKAQEKNLPMDDLLASHDSAMARLTDAYSHLIEECVGDGLWQADRQTIEKTYAAAWQIVNDIDWEMSDVEVFCEHALHSSDPAFFVMDPLGLFLRLLMRSWPSNDRLQDWSIMPE